MHTTPFGHRSSGVRSARADREHAGLGGWRAKGASIVPVAILGQGASQLAAPPVFSLSFSLPLKLGAMAGGKVTALRLKRRRLSRAAAAAAAAAAAGHACGFSPSCFLL